MSSLVMIKCVINGLKYEVIQDDRRTVLVQRILASGQPSTKFYDKFWVNRDKVLGAEPARYYFWLGAEAETV
jgi:hypothetical protein